MPTSGGDVGHKAPGSSPACAASSGSEVDEVKRPTPLYTDMNDSRYLL